MCDACDRGKEVKDMKCSCGGNIVPGGLVFETLPEIDLYKCSACDLIYHIREVDLSTDYSSLDGTVKIGG